ncbi:FtsW/RodA/SpoVE family cell cycle protein [Paenibacillus crassostreae]|uniref:Cell cycle protein n=1 Tax=Paenibacillus crassostreae TaxID=1763538 RepID=A0A167B3X1_9BACL|nr:FtsW/RodA/SpoVE family cell cycle protein [Paenibacillus crassostreae]AOZ93191.1 cell cycle protein [Paenibacillus crassostreae]OAB71718.1 cell cycle protein [Paenibacillus crassostreae]
MLRKLKKVDYVVVLVLVALMGISILSLYSVTNGRTSTGLDGHHIKMLMYYAVSFVAFIAMILIDYRLLIKYAWVIYLGGLVLLGVASLIGKTTNGAEGWLNIFGLSLQPAELFKLCLILFLTFVLVRMGKNQLAFWGDVVPLCILAFIPFAIVILQNDLGNSFSYFIILIGLLWIGNIKFTHALIGIAIMIGALIGGIQGYIHYHDEIKVTLESIDKAHWVERLDPWLVPERATAKASYHTDNAKLAIASGGMSGEGYMKGTSVQSERVPYTYSDSIFVQIAEEFGFVGASVLLLLYFVMIHRMILISLECKDRAGPYIIVGVVSMMLYQIFENIGAFLGIMPLTGITLPFISFGGTSLLINMASIGIVMSVRVHGREVEEEIVVQTSSYPKVGELN